MFDFGLSEMALLGVVALVFIGPRDLPKALKTAGFWMRKARMMTREFQSSVDDMIRDAELEELRRKASSGFEINRALENAIDPDGALHQAFAPDRPLPVILPDTPPPAPAEVAVDLAPPPPVSVTANRRPMLDPGGPPPVLYRPRPAAPQPETEA